MKLPKPGTKVDDLKCRICAKSAKDQPNDMKQCTNEKCPFAEVRDA